MTAARLILLLLLILVAVVLVFVLLRRGSAQRDAQRVEAAGLRSEADTLAALRRTEASFLLAVSRASSILAAYWACAICRIRASISASASHQSRTASPPPKPRRSARK